jgi:hypothetical protein
MLSNKINWLLKTNIRAKVCAIKDSRSYIIRTEAIDRFITYKYTTRGRPYLQRL